MNGLKSSKVKKRNFLISNLIVLSLLISIFAVPMIAYGETKIASTKDTSDYYLSSTGQPQEYITVEVGQTLKMGLYDAKTHKKLDTFLIADREEPVYWPLRWTCMDEDGRMYENTDAGSININTGIFKAKALGKTTIRCGDGLQREIKCIDVYVGGYKELHTRINNQLAMANPLIYGRKAHAIAVGQKAQLDAIYTPGNNELDINELEWKLDGGFKDEETGVQMNDIVKITNDGQIEGLKKGETTLHVTVPNSESFGSGKQVRIYVGTHYGIVEKYNMNNGLGVGGTFPLKIATFPQQPVNDANWTWSSGDTTIASVDQSGKVKGLKKGKVNISAKDSNGNTASFEMLVFSSVVYHDSYNNFEYVMNDTNMTAKITWHGHNANKEKLILPSFIKIKEGPGQPAYEPGKYAVTALGSRAIDCRGLTGVIVPDTVTKIDDYAIGYQSIPPNEGIANVKQKCKDFTIYGYSENPASAKYAKANGFHYVNLNGKEEAEKSTPTINCTGTFAKTYGDQAFQLEAKTSGNGTLSYASNDVNVAEVSNKGVVTLKDTGIATITITAAETEKYKAATKKITVTVSPQKVTHVKVKADKKKMTVSWRRDSNVSGYQVTYAQDKNFKQSKETITVRGNTTTSAVIDKLKTKQKYYVKMRAYKKTSGNTLFSSYSKAKTVNIK